MFAKNNFSIFLFVQAQYDKAMGHKQMLVEDAETCRRKMTNAMALIEGLGGEKVKCDLYFIIFVCSSVLMLIFLGASLSQNVIVLFELCV